MRLLFVAMLVTVAFSFVGFEAEADACECAAHKGEKTAYTHVNADQVKEMMKDPSVVVIDARSESAFAKMHLPTAISMPLGDFTTDRLPAAKDTQLVFYCSGPHCPLAGASAKKAADAGYSQIAVFKDGLSGWEKAQKSDNS